MMKYALPFALLGLLLASSCRHHDGGKITAPGGLGEAEEAVPMSSLPHDEFSRVSPQRGSQRR